MASAGGSHGGSFAGGFIKAFLAAAQMGLKRRQIDDMVALHKMMMKQMQQSMDLQRENQDKAEIEREKVRQRFRDLGISDSSTSGAETSDASKLGGWWTSDRIQHATDRLVKEAGLSKEGAAGLVARWAGVEAPDGPSSKNDEGSGHWGIGQWDKDRGGPSMKDASFDEQLTHAIGELNGDKEKEAADALRNAKTPEEGARGASMYERAENYDKKTGTDRYTAKTPAAAVYNAVYGKEPAAASAPIPARSSAIQPFKPYRVAGEPQPPPSKALIPTYAGGAAPPPSGQYGYPNVGQPVAPVAPAAPVAPPSGQYGYPNVGQPVAPVTPDQTMTGRTPEMLTPTAGATDPRLQPAPAQAMPSAPGTVQYNVGGVRGQQPGAGGPIYTAGQVGQPAPTLPATTGQNALLEQAPIPSRNLQQPQQVPLSQAPMPPPRPRDFGNVSTDTSGSQTPISSTDNPLWAGYQGASSDQSASADPFQNLYSSGEDFSASAGLTDTSGLLAAGEMPDVAAAEMYKGGPVIRYQRGGVIRRYASGGDTDDDFLAEYGGTDTDNPSAGAYWDMQQVNQLTNNSERSAIPDLPTSIQNRMAQQDQPPIQVPPAEPLTNPLLTQPPTEQAPTEPASTEPASTEQAPTDEQAPTEQPSSQSDIPPGSVQVAGPGGYGSVGTHRELTNIPMPRVGGMGIGRVGSGRGLSTLGGRRATSIGASGGNPLYIPGYASDNDYNHIGLAPTTNEDGTPGVWLLNMVGNGVRALFSGFNLANQGAMPGSPQQAQTLQIFGNHENPGIPTKQEMGKLRDFIDPKHEFIEAAAEIGGALSTVKFYALTGQLDLASRLSGGILLYTRMMSMEYGDQAVKSLFKGDYQGAVKFLEKSHAWVPDAKTAAGEVIDEKTGKVRAQLKDGNGTILDERDYQPAAIMEAALGARNGTSYWQFLSGLAAAGNNDPMGSHYQLQQMLRQIPGNEGVPPDPFSMPSKTLPAGTTPLTPDSTTPPAPLDTTQQAPQQAPQQVPSDSTPTAIPPKDAGGVNTGMAVPQQPVQPPTAIADRGDTSNLVAGPGAPTAAQPQQPSADGSGNYLVAREQQAPDRVQQDQAIASMLKEGNTYDQDSPYMRQKIADLDKQLAPLQQYRKKLEDQMTEVETSNMNPQDKRAMQIALAARIKDFNDTTWKNALYNRNTIIRGIDTKLKEQFNLQKSAALQQQAELNKQQDQARAYDNQRVTAEQKRRAALPANDPQLRAHEGIEPDGKPMYDTMNNRIPSFQDQLDKQLTEKDPTDASVDANPIARAIRGNNPWLSSSYDGKDPATVDMTKVPNNLFRQPDLKTVDMSARDIIMFNSGNVSYRQAQDLAANVAAGGYTIQRTEHPMIQSRVLGKIPNDDGIPRTDVIIGRGLNDQNPMRVVMSTDNANRLADLAKKSEKVTIYNRSMFDVRNTGAPTYPSQPSALPTREQPVSSATKSQIQQPPPPEVPGVITSRSPWYKKGFGIQSSPLPYPRDIPQFIMGPNNQIIPNPNYR